MRRKSRNLAIILAAGKGTRLNFKGPKPLYPISGKPMIQYIFDAFFLSVSPDMLTVVGDKKDQLIKYIDGKSKYVYQKEQLGTGHATYQCLSEIKSYQNTFVFVADAPFISSTYINSMFNNHIKTNSDCTFLFSDFPIKLPYGRLIFNPKGQLYGLEEEYNATSKVKNISTYFTSHYLFKSEVLIDLLSKISLDGKTGEYNLTETINIMLKQKSKLFPMFIEEYWKLIGINRISDLRYIQKINEKE